MKIECDKCGAKYSIADEKVRGKTFKIRCKKCSNVIIVRDKVAAAAAAGSEADAGAAVGWHLAINGETVGPMGEDEVRQRFAVGEIDRDTAVWQEGFEDWLPLGDVSAFADLAGGGLGGFTAPADDPFAAASQHDEYSGTASASGGASGLASLAASSARASATAAAPAMASAPESPRVKNLTGQRNENSVLFSLDSLQAIATGGGAAARPGGGQSPAAAPRGPKGLATSAPSSEGSGLIDIRALGAMVGSDSPSAPVSSAPVEEGALPSFGGASLGGLASTPLVPQVSHMDPVAAVGGAPPRSNAPIYVMMIVLILLVVGLGAYIFLRPPEPVVVEKTVPNEAPSVKEKDDEGEEKDKDKDKDKDEEGEKDEGGKDEEGEAEPAGEAGEAAEAGETKAGTTKPGTKKPGDKKPGDKPSGGTTKPPDAAGTKPPVPEKKPSGSESLDVDCILDPGLPKCKGGGSKPSGGTKPPPSGSTDPGVEQTLSQTDIKAGIAPVKDSAKACGPKNGAKPGEKVQVRLSISGATGTVTSATAQGAHQGTPLGNCVAAALKKATFKKFAKASIGAVYPITM